MKPMQNLTNCWNFLPIIGLEAELVKACWHALGNLDEVYNLESWHISLYFLKVNLDSFPTEGDN